MSRTKSNTSKRIHKSVLITAFIFSLVLLSFLFVILYQQDKREIVISARETISFLEGSCQRYDNYHTGKEADVMQDLLDDAQTLNDYISSDNIENESFLADYASTENLSGILIVDQNLDPIAQTDCNGLDAYSLWKDVLSNATNQNIIQYAKKTFSDIVDLDQGKYAIAMISRSDQPGVILCYQNMNTLATNQYDYSFAALLKNNTFHKNPQIVITDGENILATNISAMQNMKTVAETPIQNNYPSLWNSEDLLQINYDHTIWYGRRAVYSSYYIYVFYPSSEVFSNFIPIILGVISVYLLFLACALMIHQHVEQKNINERDKQIRTVAAIGSLYASTALLHLDRMQYEPIQLSKRLQKLLADKTDITDIVHTLTVHAVAPDFRKDFSAFLNPDTIAKRIHKHHDQTITYVYQSIDNIWYTTYIIPERYSAKDEIEGVLIATRNINDYKQNEEIYKEQLRASVQRAEIANASKTSFLRRMSHDIRTPLNGIRGMVTIAKQYLNDPTKEEECLNKIMTSSDYLLELVNDVLSMTKLEAGQVLLEHKSFDLNSILEEAFALAQMQGEGKGITFIEDHTDITHHHLIGSPLHVRQIVQNIISNSVKYNQINGTISLHCRELEFNNHIATFEFVCSDTGIGMSPDFQAHVFEPFAQEDTTARTTYTGTGLGLPIVKELVERMHGTIRFVSEKGKGTTFTITLSFPIDETANDELPESLPDDISINGTHILLVEDNELNMEIAEYLLSEKGAFITKAYNGQEAVEKFEASSSGEFDVILMDIMMPVLDGLDATRQIRSSSHPDAASIPIFAMTANAFIEDVQRSKEAGMNEHFSKPLDIHKLIVKIYQYCK